MRRAYLFNESELIPCNEARPLLIKNVPLNYCSTRWPEKDVQGDIGWLFAIFFKDGFTNRLNFMPIICHPIVKLETIREIVRIESDPDYLTNFTKGELKRILKERGRHLSRTSKLNLLDHLHGKIKKVQSVDQNILEKAIAYEEELRLSKEVQSEMAEVERKNDSIDWIDIIDKHQRMIAQKFCGEADVSQEEFLNAMRLQRVNNTPFWRRYNRAGRGFIHQGMPVTLCNDIKLITFSESIYRLSYVLANHPINIVMATSVS